MSEGGVSVSTIAGRRMALGVNICLTIEIRPFPPAAEPGIVVSFFFNLVGECGVTKKNHVSGLKGRWQLEGLIVSISDQFRLPYAGGFGRAGLKQREFYWTINLLRWDLWWNPVMSGQKIWTVKPGRTSSSN